MKIDVCKVCKTNPRTEKKRTCRECNNQFQKNWRIQNKERIDQYEKERYLQRRKISLEESRSKRKINPLPHILRGQNVRSAKFGHKPMMLKDLEKLIQEKPFCEDCGSYDELTIGHRIPLCYPTSSNSYINLIRQCKNCNQFLQGIKIHSTVATEELRKYYRVYTPQGASLNEQETTANQVG